VVGGKNRANFASFMEMPRQLGARTPKTLDGVMYPPLPPFERRGERAELAMLAMGQAWRNATSQGRVGVVYGWDRRSYGFGGVGGSGGFTASSEKEE